MKSTNTRKVHSINCTNVIFGLLVCFSVLSSQYGYAATLQPILEYRFNETGTSAPSTGSDTTPVIFPSDLHTADAGGVSGLPKDRAYDNTSAAGHGPYNAGDIGEHSADDESIDGLTSFTLVGWLNPVTVIGNNGTIIFNQDTVSEPDKGFTLSASVSGDLELEVDPTGGTGVATSDADYTDTDWFFFAVSFDGSLSSNNVLFYKGT